MLIEEFPQLGTKVLAVLVDRVKPTHSPVPLFDPPGHLDTPPTATPPLPKRESGLTCMESPTPVALGIAGFDEVSLVDSPPHLQVEM